MSQVVEEVAFNSPGRVCAAVMHMQQDENFWTPIQHMVSYAPGEVDDASPHGFFRVVAHLAVNGAKDARTTADGIKQNLIRRPQVCERVVAGVHDVSCCDLWQLSAIRVVRKDREVDRADRVFRRRAHVRMAGWGRGHPLGT